MHSCSRWIATAVLMLLAGVAPPLSAQAPGTLSGRVLDATTNLPISGAQVVIAGTNRQAVTGVSGEYSIPGIPPGAVRAVASRVGYTPSTRAVTIPAGGVATTNFQLTAAAVALDEVVVTGTVGGTERRALGNAVATIKADEVVALSEVNNVQQLINGRAPGVVLQPGSGAVGTGARIRIRGASSFSLSNEPLIYIDGVRVSNAPATGPENQGFGSNSISRLNDINPEDIESIEILKGPAAATLYGTEAASGVIQIITKKGAAGDARWSLTVKQGVNYLQNPEGRFETNYQCSVTFSVTNPCPADKVITVDIVDLENERGTPIFRNGHLQEYDLSVSGGSEQFRYFAAAGFENSEGAERSNDLERYNVRLNTTIAPSEKLDVGINLGYIDGLTNLSAEAGFGGRVFSTVLADPRNLSNPLRRGFHSGTPEGYDALYNFEQGVNRFIGSLLVNHRPMSWFTQRLSFGVDNTREDNVVFFPRIDSLVANPVFGDEALGRKDVTNRELNFITADYSATVDLELTPALRSSTSAGLQYYQTEIDSVFAQGYVFPAPGLSAVSATTKDRRNSQNFIEDVTVGVFAQQQFSWRERLFLTAGIRADDNSAFGENFDRVYYPKLSASWVVTEEPFWNADFVSALRLRAAYGESGKAPVTFAALRTYAPVTGPGDNPAVTPQFIGNPDLGPERGKEIELGFDAGFLNDRLGIDFTYYNKRTEDAILDREIAPSVGFPGRQFINAGEVRNSGIEVLTRARAIDRTNIGWDLTLNLATNDSEVVDIFPNNDDPNEFVVAGGFLRHQVGYPLGSFFEKRIVSAELDAQGQAINVRCDDGMGGAVPCAQAPEVFLGRTIPDLEGAVTSTLTLWDRLRLYTMVDFKRGQYKVNGNTRVRCTFFGGRCRENVFPTEFDAKRIAGVQSNPRLVDFLIEDASFAKLREVSLSYTLPDQWTRPIGAGRASVTLAGRNLHTWTDYTGLEPEAMFLGGSRGGNFGAFEQTTLPQLTQWVASVNLAF